MNLNKEVKPAKFFLKSQEVADALGVSVATVHKLRKSGELASVPGIKGFVFPRPAFEEYLAAQSEKARQEAFMLAQAASDREQYVRKELYGPGITHQLNSPDEITFWHESPWLGGPGKHFVARVERRQTSTIVTEYHITRGYPLQYKNVDLKIPSEETLLRWAFRGLDQP